MSRFQTSQPDSGTVAVVHKAGGTWRVLIAAARDGRPSVIEASDLPGGSIDRPDDALANLSDLLDRHAVDRVIGVLPASSVVCRTCTLPDAGLEQLEQALHLQAEVHQLGTAPEHRIAMTVLPGALGETSRTGLIFTWPESSRDDAMSLAPHAGGRPVTYAPDTAGLAALLDGLRPPDPLLWLDRASGAVSLAVTHANGAVFRSTREEAASPEEWKRNVVRALAETTLSVGHAGAFAEGVVRSYEPRIASVAPGTAKLLSPAEIVDAAADRVDGLRAADPAWWSRYGIAAGVLIAATSELAALTDLELAAAVEKPSKVRSIVAALSRPRTAFAAIVLCLLIFGLTPVAVSGLRLAILNMRYPDIDERTRAIDRTKVQLAMYRALDEEAWSMTKLLADVVCNTPEGIELEMIRLQHSDRTFSISGEARPRVEDDRNATEVITLLQQQLADTGLFSEFRPNWGDPNAYGHYQFDLTARIIRPHRPYDYEVERDFGRWTLAQRLAGTAAPTGPGEPDEADPLGSEPPGTALATNIDDDPKPEPRRPIIPPDRGGSDEPPPEDALADAGEEVPDPNDDPAGVRTRRSPRGGPGSGSGNAERLSDAEVRGGGGGPLDAYPEPLTEAQINGMDIEDVNDHLPKVAQARARARRAGETEMAERLKREFDLLMARKRSGR